MKVLKKVMSSDKIFILDKKTIKIFKVTNQLLKEHGVKETSLTDIAIKAEVARKTIYNRFQDRCDLFEKLINYTFSSLLSLINLGNFKEFSELIENLSIKTREFPLTYSQNLKQELTSLYPGLGENLIEAEKSVVKQLEIIIKGANKDHYKLRPTLNSRIAATLIWKVIVCKSAEIEQELIEEGLNLVYIENQIKDILYYGIFS